MVSALLDWPPSSWPRSAGFLSQGSADHVIVRALMSCNRFANARQRPTIQGSSGAKVPWGLPLPAWARGLKNWNCLTLLLVPGADNESLKDPRFSGSAAKSIIPVTCYDSDYHLLPDVIYYMHHRPATATGPGSGPGTVERLQQQLIKRGVQTPHIFMPLGGAERANAC